MFTFFKNPSEKYSIAIDFTDRLPASSSIASGTLSAIRLDTGVDQTSVVLTSPTAVISGTTAAMRVQAGTNGINYKLTLVATLNTGDVLEEDIQMNVVQQ